MTSYNVSVIVPFSQFVQHGVCGTYLLRAKISIKHSPQDRLQAGTDNVEREAVFNAVLVEFTESRVHFDCFFHDDEAVVEGDVEGCPHVL